MGAFYNSVCLRGDHHAEVRRSIDRWLAARGYRPTAEPILFDLDADSERSAFLIWNERWTIVLFSHFEEEWRLTRELLSSASSLLYLWVYDGQVWGYDVVDDHGISASFSSDPDMHRGFDEQQDTRPMADGSELEQRFDLPASVTQQIRRLLRARGDAETLGQQLGEAIDASAALASYDDLETGRLDVEKQAWQHSQLLYFHYDLALASGEYRLDLHRVQLDAKLPTDVELSAELLAEMQAMRRRARTTLALLKPVGLVARWWRQFTTPAFDRSAVNAASVGSELLSARRWL